MNPFGRFWNILRGKTDALLDQIENPDEQLSLFVRELEREIEKLHGAVSSAIADEKRLKMEIEDNLSRASEWESRATLALQDGKDDLAREALLKKDECEARALALQQGWEKQKAATEKLKTSLQAARVRVAEAKSKYTVLLAQYRSAKTNRKLQQTLSTTGQGSAMEFVERLNDKIRTIEAQTEADQEVDGGPVTDLDAKFMELERRAKGDEALERLKQQVGNRKPAADRPGVDEKLEALKAKLDRS